MLIDDNIFFCRLYFWEGDCFELYFFVVVDIKGMRRELIVLKVIVYEIVEKFERWFFGI